MLKWYHESKRALRSKWHNPLSVVLSNTNATHFEVKLIILQLLTTFFGKKNENLYTHVDEFLDICSIFKFQNFFDESVRLRLFLFSLKDQARAWLNHLEPDHNLERSNFKFVSKFYPMPRQTNID